MNVLIALSAALLLAAPAAPEAGWEVAARDDGITVYARTHPGGSLRELKAVGLIQAPPDRVWAAIRDYEHYTKTMPYTEESRVVGREPDGKTLYVYNVVSAPLVSRRDYVIRVVDESRWQNGKGFFKSTWTASNKGPGPRPGYVRVTQNDGYWLLEPNGDGQQTLATYYLYTDPGGSLPRFIADKANGTGVPNVFKAIRKTTAGK